MASGHSFDVLKVDGWGVLTLHSALKIEEDIWRDKEGGDGATELPLPLLEASQARAFSRAR